MQILVCQKIESFEDIRDNLYYSSNEYNRFYWYPKTDKNAKYNSIDIDQLELLSELDENKGEKNEDDRDDPWHDYFYYYNAMFSDTKNCPRNNNTIHEFNHRAKAEINTPNYARKVQNGYSFDYNKTNKQSVSKCNQDDSLRYQSMYGAYFLNSKKK